MIKNNIRQSYVNICWYAIICAIFLGRDDKNDVIELLIW